MKLLKGLCLLFACLGSWNVSAETRFQLELLHLQMNYSEKQNSISLADGEISQKMIQTRARGEWMPAAEWLVFSFEADYSGSYSSNRDRDFSMLRQNSSVGLVFNSRPFYLSLVAEQFYQDIQASDSGFGYDALNGYHVYPQLDFSFEGGSRFYLKSPLYSSQDGRELWTAGLELRLQGKPMTYPSRHFQPSYVFKVEYTSERLHFDESPVKDVETQSLMIGLGYNF